MNLIFESDSQQSGDLIKAYKENWNYSKNHGNYDSGENFLSIHWEVKNNYPNKVRLHVESPKESVDSELNKLKMKIIITIMSKVDKLRDELNKGELVISSLVDNAYKNKSTEVFHISFDDKDIINLDKKQKIIKAHENLGDFIDDYVKKYENQIEALNLNLFPEL